MPGRADCLNILQYGSDSSKHCLPHRAACSSLLCWTAKAVVLPESKMYLFCSRHCSLTLNLGEWLPKGAGVKNTEGNQEVLNFYFKFTWERLKVFCIKSKQLFSSKMACNLQAKNNHTRKSEAPLTPWRSATESWKEAKHHQYVWQWFLNPIVTPMPGPDS